MCCRRRGPAAPTSASASCCRSPGARSSTPSWPSRTRSSSARTTRATCGRCWRHGRQELRAAGAGLQADLPAALRRREGGRHLQGRRAVRALGRDRPGHRGRDGRRGGHGPRQGARWRSLSDEREVQDAPARLAWLFEPYLQDLYERRAVEGDPRFEGSRPARAWWARWCSRPRAPASWSARRGRGDREFHAERRKWLASYLFGQQLRPRLPRQAGRRHVELVRRGAGRLRRAVAPLLHAVARRGGPDVGHLHARLSVVPDGRQTISSSCATACSCPRFTWRGPPTDPKAEAAMARISPGWSPSCPSPAPPTPGQAAWKSSCTRRSTKRNDKVQRTFNPPRASAARERANPPPMIKKVNFCNAAARRPSPSSSDDDRPHRAARAAARVLDMNRLPVDGAVRRLAGLGLRRLRRPALQLRGAQLRAHAAGAAASARPRRRRRRCTGAGSSPRSCSSAGPWAASSSGRSPIASAARARCC